MQNILYLKTAEACSKGIRGSLVWRNVCVVSGGDKERMKGIKEGEAELS